MNLTPSARPRVEWLEDRLALSTAAYVTSLYNDLLGRFPSGAEVVNFATLLNQTGRPDLVANAFVNSVEFRSNLIRLDYLNLLNREPAAAEVGFWLDQLNRGLSEKQVEAAFLGSEEYFQQQGRNPVSFITEVYRDVLGRLPEQEGLNNWLFALQSGASREQVALGIVASTEAHTRVVTAVYRQLLDRNPDLGGLFTWVALLDRGFTPSALVAQFASSPEYVVLNSQGGLDVNVAFPAVPPIPGGFVVGPGTGDGGISLVVTNPAPFGFVGVPLPIGNLPFGTFGTTGFIPTAVNPLVPPLTSAFNGATNPLVPPLTGFNQVAAPFSGFNPALVTPLVNPADPFGTSIINPFGTGFTPFGTTVNPFGTTGATFGTSPFNLGTPGFNNFGVANNVPGFLVG